LPSVSNMQRTMSYSPKYIALNNFFNLRIDEPVDEVGLEGDGEAAIESEEALVTNRFSRAVHEALKQRFQKRGSDFIIVVSCFIVDCFLDILLAVRILGSEL